MSVQIAEGSVLLILDRSQFDADLAALQSEVAALSGGGGGGFSGGGARPSGGGGGGSGGGGPFNAWVNWKRGNSETLNRINRAGYDFANSAEGREFIGGFRGGDRINQAIDLGNRTGGTREFFLGENDTSRAFSTAEKTGGALGSGMSKGIRDKAEEIAREGRNAVRDAIEAAREEAEIASPSRRGAREIGVPIAAGIAQGIFTGQQEIIDAMGGGAFGVPIMQQVQAAMQFSTANMLQNMWSAARFSFWNWGMGLLGGLPGFGGLGGLNVVNGNNNVFGQGLGNIFANQWDAGQTESAGILFPGFLSGLDRFGVSSRSVLGQLPNDVREFGATLLEGLLDSILPGFAAGPVGDMLTTLLGLRPIISREAALAEGVFSSTGTGFGSDDAFSDYPFRGGFVMQNNFEGTGEGTVQQQVAWSILQSMRRLGISIAILGIVLSQFASMTILG